jgi:hypothetical protein
MNYAIVTKFLGPTNTRGSRVKAFLPSGLSVTLSWDHALNSQENHHKAAKACVQKHIVSGAEYLAEKAPFVRETFSAYGLNGGLLCIVLLIDKAQAV